MTRATIPNPGPLGAPRDDATTPQTGADDFAGHPRPPGLADFAAPAVDVVATPRRIAMAMTGASGAPYGLRLLECLLAAGVGIDLMISKPGRVVLGLETPLRIPANPSAARRQLSATFGAKPEQLHVWGDEQWTAPVASGSGFADAMVVCPCSMATVSAIAIGASRGLIERAADVAIKERRDLILVVRETPFSAIHLENLLKLARLGVCILPANPAFYHAPNDVSGLVDFIVARVLDQLRIPHRLMARWGRSDGTAPASSAAAGDDTGERDDEAPDPATEGDAPR